MRVYICMYMYVYNGPKTIIFDVHFCCTIKEELFTRLRHARRDRFLNAFLKVKHRLQRENTRNPARVRALSAIILSIHNALAI